MSYLGTTQTLFVKEVSNEGAYLDGHDLGEVFLPKQEIKHELEAGDSISVFIYLDNANLPTATVKKPHAQVGEYALLRVKEINSIGAFIDWGLDKDVLVPFNEQKPRMQEGHSYLVRLYLDNASQRICASNNFNRFLSKDEPEYSHLQEVDLIVAGKTDIGYKVLIEESHFGVVFYNMVFKNLFVGQKLKGFVQKVREDGKIDVVLEKPGMGKVSDLSEKILEKLKQEGGILAIGDKSDPELIKKVFSTSKANYKKAIGGLFKQELIEIEAKSIRLKS
ncbi:MULTISPECIES: CvfB family protein [Pseudoalteromonas]|uniref:CvfB family protein n=1 Tax=Pseudoalteromonas TaxID=53246 RepID=UPI0007324437|nr:MULTISPECIES: S1-like domain-containing RNA-binding protein [Pseudoalteromonas]KTF12097.1 GntR family transcriptional regulator [Pseudoalteromonas sp. H103]MCQ8888335.1 S1-like domain-containing RNA-binding protein [Pseudoalteromonas carrageenovora]MDO6463191.1 S1-like domain-containing RNA-binding protein [Pseudoalteromonas carrageenovora]MDO6545950.1 S1-like domain-containing RNA-binding protein [Pseudoalteromonas carrageenovora]MDO6637528.1 S1-like domain-containing RNA-binding protein [|tara:strand:+ start:207 stop:1040 length:834 start_codon:yes stop_codon:yes gene_type:complete